MFTPHRQKEAWLQKVHRKIQTAAIQEAIKAFKLAKNHGKGNLKFKKKTEMECRQTIISVERPTISEDRKAVKLPGFGEYVRVLDLREEITADNICSMYKITKEIDESTGETKYFINLSYKEECIEPSPHNENAIGFDRGIKKQLMSAQMITTNQTKTAQTKIETTTTTQEYTTIPEQMKQDELSRDKQKSNMARNKNKKSKRYKRARTEMKRKYKKNANRRADNENKLVLLLCTMFGTIFVENLNLKGMTTHGGNRKRYINRWLRFANHGEFMRKLQYKSLLLGCTLQAVGAAYTSLTCFKCEHASKNNRYKEVFCCTKCGYLDHADRNAACNILRKGLLSFLQTKTVRWVEYPSLNGYVSHLEKLQSGLCISNVPQTFQGFDRFF